MELIIKESGLYSYHAKEAGEKGKTRTENLEELIRRRRESQEEKAQERRGGTRARAHGVNGIQY